MGEAAAATGGGVMRGRITAETVARCVARQDGGYLIVTRQGSNAVSTEPLGEGVSVTIRDGRAERVRQ